MFVSCRRTPKMASASRIQVKDRPTRIAIGDAFGSAEFLVRNQGNQSIHLGGEDVAPHTGYELHAGEAMSMPLGSAEELYGITDFGVGGDQRVDVISVKAKK
jgi:hypothetical protein